MLRPVISPISSSVAPITTLNSMGIKSRHNVLINDSHDQDPGDDRLFASAHGEESRKTTVKQSSSSKVVKLFSFRQAERKTDVAAVKRTVEMIAMLGITIALFTVCLIVGLLSLIYSLQPGVPTGTILPYGGSASTLLKNDDQWLFCDGSAVSRTKYSALFLVIGTVYGAGDGATTFNLPDLRHRFLWGSSGTNDTVLPSGGSATHTLTIAQIPTHTHSPGTLATASGGSHTHNYTQVAHNHGGSTGTRSHPSSTSSVAAGSNFSTYTDVASQSHSISSDTVSITIQSAGAHTHAITGATASEGQGQAFDKMPPYQTIHYIIRI